ncbi:hypothetical protein HLB23_16560 [Nocardia uniformis]|uniref:DUF8020 domain-containing protein n=1 Tax=Nocardia uniformis TaxID=53432 RepID=A0A849C551_9NOCA|nr:hypothetical protein [Nocardia uniformis]NNH71455.1 hypothetical protein [Nocardia uniformis]
MKFGTFAGTTLLTIAAMGIATGSVAAKPALDSRENAWSGVEQGIGYRAVLDHFDQVISTSVDGGKFEVTADGGKVLLKSDDGDTVAAVPLVFEISEKRLELAEQISDNGEKLTLTPRVDAKEIGELRQIGSMDRLVAELDKNMVGVVIGGILGGILGAAAGLMMLSIITGPIGLLVGAIAGGYLMGGQAFLDAVMAVLTGQP